MRIKAFVNNSEITMTLNLKILHIGADTQFIHFLAQDFEAVAPACNSYILVTNTSKPRFSINNGNCYLMPSGEMILARIIKFLNLIVITRKYDIVITHGLTLAGMIAFIVSPKRVIKVWSGFGADYYGHGYAGVRYLLGSKTRSVTDRLYSEGKLTVSQQSRIKTWMLKLLRVSAVSKADYFSAPLPNDYAIMRNTYPHYSGKYSQLIYGSVEREFATGVEGIRGSNILVGNSASFENNHLDMFEIISRHDVAGRKIIVPLSYGDNAYRDLVFKHGERLFGSAFHPLVDYLPLEEYVNLIASCGIVIMGHKRQAALGNIGSALYHGARVYLDPTSTTYKFLTERGAKLFELQDLSNGMLPDSILPDNFVSKNRQVLESFWGEQAVRDNVTNLLNMIRQSKRL